MIDCSYIFDSCRNLYGYISYFNRNGEAIKPLRYLCEITYKCNLRCPYCYIGENSVKQELTTQELIDLIAQIPAYGLVSFLGGEPFIRPDFLELFETASKQTYGKTHVITNGSLMNEKIIDSFIKHKLLMLSVSLDGYGQTHDFNRGKEGLFETVCSNLEMLKSKKKNKKPMVDIKTVILENNLDDLPKLYKLCNDMGFDFFSLAFKRNHTLKQTACMRDNFSEEFYKQEYPVELYFDMEHFKEIYKEIECMSKKSKTFLRWAPKFKPSGDIKNIEKFFSSGNKPVNDIYKPCVFPFSNVFINPEGDMYPCLSLRIGNVRGKKMIDLINEPKYRCFRKNLKASKLFNSCQTCCELVPKIQ